MTPEEALNQEAAWALRSVLADAKPDQQSEYRLRAGNYTPRTPGQRPYNCPRCWVRSNMRAPLRAVPGTEEYDCLRCEACDADIVVPFE